MTNKPSRVYDLIIECCRSESDTLKLENLAGQITDWNAFLGSSYAHGIYPLIAKSLKPISTVPEHIKSILKITNLDIARRNMMMTSELLRVMNLLEKNNILALAIKGPVLSQMIYSDVTQRQYADLDILVKEKDLYAATQLLTKDKYTFERPIEVTKNKALLKATKDISLRQEHLGVDLEMHWRLFSGRLFKKSNIDFFRDNQQYITLNQHQITTLNNKILIVYLLLHGSKHMWERLEWIIDIDRLVRLHTIDWEIIEDIANEMNVIPMIRLGCAVAYKFFETPFPENQIQKFEQDASIVNARQIIINDIYADKIFEVGRIMNIVYYLGIGKISQRWYEYAMRLLRYTKEDVYSVNLPNILSSCYHIVHLYNSALYRIKKSFL